MKTFTQEEVLARYDKLPDVIKDAMMEEATAQKMSAIGKTHGLLLDKVGIMAEETGYVMLGLEHPNNFVANLKEALEISEDKAIAIAQDINQQVFKPIREHLMDIHKIVAEKPKPSFAPKNKEEDTFISKPKASQAAPENASPARIIPPAPPPPTPSAPKPEAATPTFRTPSFAMPLGGETVTPPPPQKQSEEKPKAAQSKPTYKTGEDPYREPIQ